MSEKQETPPRVWRTVPNWPEYEVSDDGYVRRTSTQRILKTVLHHGYKALTLSRGNHPSTVKVAALVAEAFIGPRPKGYTINHIDGVKVNNHHQNLEYCTQDENMKHAQRIGLLMQGETHWAKTHPDEVRRGNQLPHSKLNEEAVRDIRKTYQRGKGGELARKYGVGIGAIHNVVSGKFWKHVQARDESEGQR